MDGAIVREYSPATLTANGRTLELTAEDLELLDDALTLATAATEDDADEETDPVYADLARGLAREIEGLGDRIAEIVIP